MQITNVLSVNRYLSCCIRSAHSTHKDTMFLHKLRPIGHVVSQAPPKWPFRCSERVRIARYTQSPRIPATGLDTDTPLLPLPMYYCSCTKVSTHSYFEVPCVLCNTLNGTNRTKSIKLLRCFYLHNCYYY